MIVAAYHMRDLHQSVVDNHDIVVDRHAAGTQNDRIADHFTGELDFAVNDVMKTDGPGWNLQADSSGLALRAPAFGFLAIERAALARVNWLAMLRLGAFAISLQLLLGTETQVGFVLAQ